MKIPILDTKQTTMRIAVVITVFNRIEQTVQCLNRLFESVGQLNNIELKVFLTDDGSSDGTQTIIRKAYPENKVKILQGTGQMFWNAGMIHAWNAAIQEGGWNGYLWLNNDTMVFDNLWQEIMDADEFSNQSFGQSGIYVGSTCDETKTKLTYGGFHFINRWTLKDKFVIPDGTFQQCQCAHGNIVFVSRNVVDSEGVFCDKYVHSGGDHDYTFLAQKHGFPLLVLRNFVGQCNNDHSKKIGSDFENLPLKERLHFLKSPRGFNLNNTLLFQRRCFPYRYPFVFFMGYFRAFLPGLYYRIYSFLRR